MSEPAAIDRAAGKPPLDEIMLAMDVVDTLRRRERLAKTELDDLGRAEDLVARLRTIYAEQGLEVPDRVIEQGVAALKEERFTYRPPPDTLGTRLALLYVRRGRWGKWLGGIVALGVLAVGVGYVLLVAPAAADISDTHDDGKPRGERVFHDAMNTTGGASSKR
ncbi:DUF6384 family protein [uncultured Thiodictyon sp.]|uniref:DUF6384 family protein n=1 Tax=uncultured Thiodictyon sp. TaxID=1846217 RepID=UPI0026006F7C|nr:DUF6384 family protein [uncultured Thiodictyon sp.]